MSEKKIIIGSDHGGYRLKELLKEYVKTLGYAVLDEGCFSEESCDYPYIAHKVADRVKAGEGRGILICGTGIGMSIVANRIQGIRAALCHNEYTARMSRKHNDANILVLGGRIIGDCVAFDIVDIWMTTEFEGGRHQRRIDMINKG